MNSPFSKVWSILKNFCRELLQNMSNLEVLLTLNGLLYLSKSFKCLTYFILLPDIFWEFKSFQPQTVSILSTRNFPHILIISCVQKVRFLRLSSPVRIDECCCLLLKIDDLVWPENRSGTGCRRREWCCDCWASTVKCTLIAEDCVRSFFIFGFAAKNSCQPAISFRSSS